MFGIYLFEIFMRDLIMSYQKNTNFLKAIKYIYNNIENPITLEDISKNLGISASSLKRLFINITNKTPGAFIRRLRMELAFRTLQNQKDSILEVALSSGFDDQSAFARAFKEMFGYSPRQARNKMNIVNELESVSLAEPEFVELNNLPIQSITEQGHYYISAIKAWEVLKSKLSQQELNDDFSGFFIGIGHDNPHDEGVEEDKVRFSAAVTHVTCDLEIEKRIISKGVYARFLYIGKPVNLGLAYHFIYGKWSESSSHKINKNIPAFVSYDSFPEALEEQNIMIHVPLLTLD